MMMENRQSKRHTVYINKVFQGRFVASVTAIILIFGSFSGGLIYWLIGSNLESQIFSAHLNIEETWTRLGIAIVAGNVLAAILAVLMAYVVILRISHKIAGPLYRFETLCEQVGNGNLSGIKHIRKTDQLQELAEAFASMTDKLRQQQDDRKQLVEKIDGMIEELQGASELTPEQISAMQAIKDTVKQIN